MRVLVTGGAGFIGSHVAGLLACKAGSEVCVLDDLSTGRKGYVPVQARFDAADIEDAEAIGRIVGEVRPHAVMHLAAQVNVRRSLEDPVFDARKNVIGSLNVIEAARRAGTRRLIFASTGGAIYGEQEYHPADEEHPTRPEAPYGLAKLTVERYLDHYRRAHGLEVVILRLANVFGPRQDPRGEAGVVAIFAERLLQGGAPVIFGDGRQTRDFVYVTDVARAFVSALQAAAGTYNIGTGSETSVNDIYRMVARAAGASVEPAHGPAVPGELMRSSLRCEKARQEMGWAPEVLLAEGIERTVRFFRTRAEADQPR